MQIHLYINILTKMIDKKIQSALISVFNKDGLSDILRRLNELGVNFISTGGTEDYIKSLGYSCIPVEKLTGYPSILGGRVKTLHPKIFGGILSRQNIDKDQEDIKEYEIEPIDLVIVDLYPFEDTVNSKASHEDIIEKIDIGGISLIRAAAKNYSDVIIVASKDQYQPLLNLLENKNGVSSIQDRSWFAKEAFAVSSGYDTAIFNYLDTDQSHLRVSADNVNALRYGENPHQKGSFYGDLNNVFDKLHGKEISYNNLLDIDAAINVIRDFDESTIAILKHNNVCGIASRANLIDAWKDALAGDPVSAFGGIIVCNQNIDTNTAKEINQLFFEIVIAPSYDDDALSIFKEKKNRIILQLKDFNFPQTQFRSLLNGVLLQDVDRKTETADDLKYVTKTNPSKDEITDLIFANKLVKHTKSNAIVLVKNKQLCASGVGQTSRVDALQQAIQKANAFGLELSGAVMASDAFFPFPDCVEIAHKAGIKSIVQPGGSIKDNLSVEYCDSNQLSMVMTGTRHFKH